MIVSVIVNLQIVNQSFLNFSNFGMFHTQENFLRKIV